MVNGPAWMRLTEEGRAHRPAPGRVAAKVIYEHETIKTPRGESACAVHGIRQNCTTLSAMNLRRASASCPRLTNLAQGVQQALMWRLWLLGAILVFAVNYRLVIAVAAFLTGRTLGYLCHNLASTRLARCEQRARGALDAALDRLAERPQDHEKAQLSALPINCSSFRTARDPKFYAIPTKTATVLDIPALAILPARSAWRFWVPNGIWQIHAAAGFVGALRAKPWAVVD